MKPMPDPTMITVAVASAIFETLRLLTPAVWQSSIGLSRSLELAASGSPRKAPRSGRNEDGES
jgi:hypothetical protein